MIVVPIEPGMKVRLAGLPYTVESVHQPGEGPEPGLFTVPYAVVRCDVPHKTVHSLKVIEELGDPL